MADPRFRLDRLLRLLPAVLAAQPEDSAVGALLRAMAQGLAELDAALLRAQRDHWVNLAQGEAGPGEAASALERLAQPLGLARLPQESPEAFRQRLLLSARVFTHGLATPRALLELAIIALGAEPCAKLEANKDAILAWGLPLGTRRNCPACRGQSEGGCPNAAQRVLQAWITDNPPRRQAWSSGPLLPEARFAVPSSSLHTDIPVLKIKAGPDAVSYPFVQNLATGEVMLYAGTLAAGATLSLWPQILEAEWRRFDSHDGIDSHPWRRQFPSGSGMVIGAQGQARAVNADIYYLFGATFPLEEDSPNPPRFASHEASEGVRFADALSRGNAFDAANAQFDAAHFGSSSQQARAPRLRPGADAWRYGVYTKADIIAVAGRNAGPLHDLAPDAAQPAAVTLEFKWFARPPAQFRLTVPRNTWVMAAEQRGAIALIRRQLQQAKAAGVEALLEFPEAPQQESHALAAALALRAAYKAQEAQALGENPPHWSSAAAQIENLSLQEGTLSWRGVFGATALDWSHFE
jgi:hypothetical protein